MTDEATTRPFSINIPQDDLDDLLTRLARTRWPRESPEAGWSRGVPLAYLQELTRYWATGFDWRKQEAELNEFDQFVTTISGQDVHFLHVRSPEAGARPLILIHGWPSSPFEFRKVIGPLTDPRAHGLDPAAAFHVVIPSLPGYGFSTPVTAPGAGILFRVAQQFAELMNRLGYQRFAVQATDVGSGVAGMLPMVAPNTVIGIHLTGTVAAMPFGPAVAVDGLTVADRARAERFNQFQADGLGYLHLQSSRPQTLAYALTDSPVGQLAWIAEKFQEWTDPAATTPEAAVGRDELLTTVSIFWFTGAGASSAHAVYDGMQAWRAMAAHESDAGDWSDAPAGPPVGYAVFAGDTAIRTLADPTGQIAHWSEFDSGGHFPAMETPSLLVDDVRGFFADLG